MLGSRKIKDYILSSWLFFVYRRIIFLLKYQIRYIIFGKINGGIWLDTYLIRKRYKKTFGNYPDLEKPKKITEKMQWLKIHDRQDYYSICADKYRVREIIKKYDEDILVPLLFVTEDWREIIPENIPEYPCIIKANNGCGSYQILKSKEDTNWKKLRYQARLWIKNNHYYRSQEYQYKNIRPCYIVERLLVDKMGQIPEDYKLHFINGKLIFIHCGVKSEGRNYKLTYDSNWNPLPFSWYRINSGDTYIRGQEIEKPATLDRMIEIGTDIAKKFPYVRVDFYDVDGKLYFGEITLCHGSGLNKFIPAEYDVLFGNLLSLDTIR